MQVVKLIFIFILLTTSSFAKKKAIVVGGSCEFDKLKQKPPFPGYKLPAYMKSNLAHRPMTRLSSMLGKRGYEVDLNYASKKQTSCGDTCSESAKCSANSDMDAKTWSLACVKRDGNIQGEIEENTIDNFVADINRTASEISNSGQKSQVLITFVTHGMPTGYNNKGAPKSGLKSHGICFNKPGGGYEYVPVDDPRIKGALDKLKESGANIGIIDHSCYGGETTRLLSDYGCVLSSQTDKNPSTAGMGIVNTLNKMLEKGGDITLADTFFDNHVINDFEMKFGDSNYGLSSNEFNFPTMNGYDDPLRNFLNDFNYAAPKSEVVLNRKKNSDDITFSYSCEDMLEHFDGALKYLAESGIVESLEMEAIKDEYRRITGNKAEDVDDLVEEIVEDLESLKALNIKAKKDADRANEIADSFGTSSINFPEPDLSKLRHKFSKEDQKKLTDMFKMYMSDFGGEEGEMSLSHYDFSTTFSDKNLKVLRKSFSKAFTNEKSRKLKSKRNIKRAFDMMVSQMKDHLKANPDKQSEANQVLALGAEMNSKLANSKDFENGRYELRAALKKKVKQLRLYSLINSKLKGDFNPDCANFKI